jgi:mannosyltransferase OCH1-like enzyme
MIPKIIHYCWFGQNPIPENFQNYINNWQYLMPDYRIVKWDESNSPLYISYIQNAQKNKMWANISNYVRLYALWQYGGIYLDTDVEVLKSFDELIVSESGILGFESGDFDNNRIVVNNAVMLFPSRHWFIKECIEYIESNFYGTEAANISSPKMTTFLLKKYGLRVYKKQNIVDMLLLPRQFFYPYNYDEEFTTECIKEDTFTIHHWAKTWESKKTNFFIPTFLNRIKSKIFRSLPKEYFIYKEYGKSGLILFSDLKVQHGLFKGMKYASPKALGSSLMPKLLGSYEDILHPFLFEQSKKKFELIINIGCGEGFYAVGLALLFNDTKVLAYDINDMAEEFIKNNTLINNVENRVQFKNDYFDVNESLIALPRRTFIFCDIEGGELSLFSKENIIKFSDSDLIIELHDFIDFNIKPYIIALFKDSHSIEILKEKQNYDFKNYDFLYKTPISNALKIIDENRPERMEWVILKSNKYL